MKKFIFIFLFFLCLSFNMLIVPSMAEPKTVKEGLYTTNDLNILPDTDYTIQNTSLNEPILVVLFDSNEIILQFIRLTPQSEKYIMPPIKSGYEIAIVGKGEAVIS